MLNLKEEFDKASWGSKVRISQFDIFSFLISYMGDGIDIISAAEHDEIFLNVDLDALAKLATEKDIEFLASGGVFYSETDECLKMFI